MVIIVLPVKISVLIITRNRAKILKKCLNSLINQDIFELIVVDNGSEDTTKELVLSYKGKLPIRYIREEKTGIPFARNLSIIKSRGTVLGFIDDDCVADKNWIANAKKLFLNDKKIDGIIGYSKSALNNIFSLAEQVYYERNLLCRLSLVSLNDHKQYLPVSDNTLLDFKNAFIRRSVFNNLNSLFSENVPFGDVGDEDVEFSTRVFAQAKFIVFSNRVRVSHMNSISFSRLVVRNYYHGVSNFLLKKENKIDLTNLPLSLKIKKLIISYTKNSKLLSSLGQRISFLILCCIYPLIYKIGYLRAFLIKVIFKSELILPKRK